MKQTRLPFLPYLRARFFRNNCATDGASRAATSLLGARRRECRQGHCACARRRRVCAIAKRNGRCIFHVIMRLHLQIHIFLNYRIITCTEYSLSFILFSYCFLLFYYYFLFYYFYFTCLVFNILQFICFNYVCFLLNYVLFSALERI